MPYRPAGAARDLFYCRDREVLIEGPSGTGKTRAVLEKVYTLADKYPYSRHLLVRKTRASMSESVLAIFETHVVPGIQGNAHRSNRTSYELPNGATLVLGGLDNVDRIMSAEYDTVALFEATEASLDDWERLLTRLRNGKCAYHQGIADCNPGHPGHWLNRRAADGLMSRLLSRHSDNPTVTQEYLDGLARLTGPRRSRLLEGKWAGMEGLVYDVWDRAVHVIPSAPIPAEAPRFCAVDFGIVNPASVLWAYITKDGEIVVYRELYQTGKLASALAAEVKGLEAGEHVVIRWADHDAQERAIFDAASVYTVPADKAVQAGIQAVYGRLLPSEKTGRPRLFVHADSLVRRDLDWAGQGHPASLAEEIEGYVWDVKPDGSSAKEQPHKRDDHACDALRYLVMGVNSYYNVPIPVGAR